MVAIIENEDIAFAHVDVIVSAANGIGYMGGSVSANKLCKGVAEHLNYYTQGKIEKEAKHVIKASGKLVGFPPGSIYKTSTYGLDCKCVFHAVTMLLPGTSASEKAIRQCLELIYRELHDSGYKSVAVPLLGCGTGGLNPEKVKTYISAEANYYPEIKTLIFVGGKGL